MPAIALQIASIALPFAKDIIVAWMQASGKTEVTLAELQTKSPDEILKEMGIDLNG